MPTCPEDQASRSLLAPAGLQGPRGLPSVAQLHDMAVSQLPKRFQRLGPIRKQGESALRADNNPATPDQMVTQWGLPQGHGNLRDRQEREASWSRLGWRCRRPCRRQIGLDRTGEDRGRWGERNPCNVKRWAMS